MVEGVKKRLREIWGMNCDQSISYDEELAAKDAEIVELNRKLPAAQGTCDHSDHKEPVAATASHQPLTTSGSHRGKAPTGRPFLW